MDDAASSSVELQHVRDNLRREPAEGQRGAHCTIAVQRATAGRGDERGGGGLAFEVHPGLGTDRSHGPQVFHSYLTGKFGSFGEVASYAKALQGRTFDKQGTVVEVIHKGAKANRPPPPPHHSTRRGARRGEALWWVAECGAEANSEQ